MFDAADGMAGADLPFLCDLLTTGTCSDFSPFELPNPPQLSRFDFHENSEDGLRFDVATLALELGLVE